MSHSPKSNGAAPLSINDLIGLARLDFGVFAVVMFSELHDGAQMVPAPYVNLMAEALMAVRAGTMKRLIFNLPPGHMKSLIVSVLFTAWLLGVEPSKRILCVSYGDDLTRQLSPDPPRDDFASLPADLPKNDPRQTGGRPSDDDQERAAPRDRGRRNHRGFSVRTYDHRRPDAAR